MMANNKIGTIQESSELPKIARRHGIPFHTDAVQAVGHIPIHVHKIGLDLLSALAHIFNGPKGVGLLYIRRGMTLPPLIDGGHQEMAQCQRKQWKVRRGPIPNMISLLEKHGIVVIEFDFEMDKFNGFFVPLRKETIFHTIFVDP